MDTIQLCDEIDRIASEASAAMDDETANRSYILETLLAQLAAVTFTARRSPRRPGVVNVAEGSATVGIQMGHITGGHFSL
ncbi:hypothetical protein Cme02nite_45230 [Catellatospora methionotrophica]|uniref:Uncharacterized protein n=1 Tax=Catellatospora methionotrophica TaxID=121620 RepID=A0A8J3LJ87_9ACTN|nr:hypothetical protein [Catellatospora methionotrophica]GIG16191.1 hypothetical protein Cme02nite_45230 [Catellatospora methionotrophica]